MHPVLCGRHPLAAKWLLDRLNEAGFVTRRQHFLTLRVQNRLLPLLVHALIGYRHLGFERLGKE